MFCWQVNRNPVPGCIGVSGFWMCAQDTCFRLLSHGRAKRYMRYSLGLPWSSSSACCVVMLFFSYIYFFESKGHVFELPRLVQICRVGFSPARHFVCLRLDLFFDFIVKRESPAVMCAQVQMVLRFDSNGLLWFSTRFSPRPKLGFGHISVAWQTSRSRLRFTHTCLGFQK